MGRISGRWDSSVPDRLSPLGTTNAHQVGSVFKGVEQRLSLTRAVRPSCHAHGDLSPGVTMTAAGAVSGCRGTGMGGGDHRKTGPDLILRHLQETSSVGRTSWLSDWHPLGVLCVAQGGAEGHVAGAGPRVRFAASPWHLRTSIPLCPEGDRCGAAIAAREPGLLAGPGRHLGFFASRKCLNGRLCVRAIEPPLDEIVYYCHILLPLPRA